MNGFKAFYKDKVCEVWAESSYQAQLKAMEEMNVKPKDRHKITVMLCVKADGSQYEHSPC